MKKQLNRLFGLIGLVVFLIPFVSCQENKDSSSPAAISIATAGMGGTYYPVGVAISEILNTALDNVNAQVEVTGGTVENPSLVNNKESDIGLANADMALFAYEGELPFDTAMPNLSGFFNGLSPGVVHYLTLESSGVMTLTDLQGKKIAVGPQGNSTSLFLRKVLGELGLQWDDINPSYLSFSDGVAALKDGKVDMAIVTAGIGASAVKELAASHGFRVLEFDDAFRGQFLEAYPYYIPYTIPADAYGLDKDIQTVATENMVMIRADLDEELVYSMTRAIFENLDTIYNAHPSAKNLVLEIAPKTSIPLHPGAERYYREVGAL